MGIFVVEHMELNNCKHIQYSSMSLFWKRLFFMQHVFGKTGVKNTTSIPRIFSRSQQGQAHCEISYCTMKIRPLYIFFNMNSKINLILDQEAEFPIYVYLKCPNFPFCLFFESPYLGCWYTLIQVEQ